MSMRPTPGGEGLEDAPLPGMIGEHPLIKSVYRLVRRVAPTNLPVAIVGETGTGKELVARALHLLSPRSREAFVAVNAAALPESLFESELFGHEAGAFSDAKVPKPGLLEEAHEGTFFCDELPSLSSVCQAKLLRVIEDGVVRRVGGLRSRPAAPRWVAACQQWDSNGRRAEGVREDLWQRIAAVVITVPPLRERQADVAMLATSFLANQDHGELRFADEALAALSPYEWPGNVRELRQVVTRLALDAVGNVISGHNVNRILLGAGSSGRDAWRAQVESALRAESWNVTRAAGRLGVRRSTLHRWIRGLGLIRPRGGVDLDGPRPGRSGASCFRHVVPG